MKLSAEHPRYGYRRIAVLLRQEGWRVGKRHILRLRRDAGLRVPPTKRKLVRRGVSTGLPTKATHRNHLWTWDFIADATVSGGALKLLIQEELEQVATHLIDLSVAEHKWQTNGNFPSHFSL